MALINTVAALSEAQICAFRRDPTVVLAASRMVGISSFGIGGWTDPVGILLNEVMLEGEVVSPMHVHDRDVPRFHDVARTRSLALRIGDVLAKPPPASSPDSMDDWVRSELSRAFDVVKVAAERSECVFTAWEVIGGVRGVAPRIRERQPGEGAPVFPLAAPQPLVVAGCIAGGILAAVLWRQRRLRAMRVPKT